MVRNFEELRAWQKSMDLVSEVYEIVLGFPKEEIYGLTSQLKRAVVSVPSNIAEGCGSNTDKGFVNYLHNALGSVKEVKCQLIIAKRLGFLGNGKIDDVIIMADEVAGMLMRFIKKVCEEKME
jgi:four helix bundle protein